MINRRAWKLATAAGIALAALGTASTAQARGDVFFTIGASVAPGLTLGISSAPFYRPAPVYYAPATVYYGPAHVYYQSAPVYYHPAPVYYQSTVLVARPLMIYGPPYYRHGHGYRHGRHWH